jgi:hypothetical protein
MLSNYKTDVFMNLIKSREIKIDPKNEFIDNLKNSKSKRNERKDDDLNDKIKKLADKIVFLKAK